jgi:hypothetical protein
MSMRIGYGSDSHATNFGPIPKFKRLVMDNRIKKSSRKSVQSVSIGVKQLEDAAEVAL